MNNNDYLRLGAMFAGNTISVTSEKGFKMSSANSGIAESYIQAGKKLVFDTNKTTGIVGEAGNAIRILNDRAPVNIEAGSAYIRGVHNGTLVLGNIEGDILEVVLAGTADGDMGCGHAFFYDLGGFLRRLRGFLGG